jgi:hypothetical protein
MPAEDLVTAGSPGSHLEPVPDVATQARLGAMLVAVAVKQRGGPSCRHAGG